MNKKNLYYTLNNLILLKLTVYFYYMKYLIFIQNKYIYLYKRYKILE